MTASKNQLSEYADTVKAGSAWYYGDTSSKPTLKQALPAIATSNTADAFLISAWGLYHGFGPITALRKSRGYTWRVEFRSCEAFVVSVVNPYDHREGVKIESQLSIA